MTIDILICTLNKGIVRVKDILFPPQEGVNYIVSYQYTDERYLELVPDELLSRADVKIYKYFGQGLSANRNLAMEKATSDIVMYADDDSRLTPECFQVLRKVFEENPKLDVAFFTASTYTGKPLKNYPSEERVLSDMPEEYIVSAIEMACQRENVQGYVRFDERFGLGTKFLTCGEEEIWMEDAKRAKLSMKFFPIKTVETSTLLKKSMIYVDPGVQRSYGAIMYYKYGVRAWSKCFHFAFDASRNGMAHFFTLMRHLYEGIRYIRST